MSMSSGASVAIIGGGISGLVCAARFKQLGMTNVTVYDTGKNSPGGRCSTREISIDGVAHIFDHSAQYFTVSNMRFANIVSHMFREGAIQFWNGSIGNIDAKGNFTKYPDSYQAFIGNNGMQSVSQFFASLVDVKRPAWISNVEWEFSSKKWRVGDSGFYDYLVIAHNGKCADRLMSNAGVPKIHRLLQVNFTDKLNPKVSKMQLCSIWCLIFAVPGSLKLKFSGAHSVDSDISWICNNTEKYGTNKACDAAKLSAIPSLKRKPIECWTIFSTREFGTANKVPQENIPPRKEKEITQKLLSAFCRITKKTMDQVKPVYTKVQLWGAAVPMNILDNGANCAFDPEHNVGICGDWLSSPSIEGAAVSGLELAERIQAHTQGKGSGTKLDPKFISSGSNAIGDFSLKNQLNFKPS